LEHKEDGWKVIVVFHELSQISDRFPAEDSPEVAQEYEKRRSLSKLVLEATGHQPAAGDR